MGGGKMAELDAKKLAKCLKEGGKKGVDIAGAADMTLGLEFFCTTMEQPEGNVDLLEYCMAGANKEVDPDAEERKGGSGHIGKMLLSAGTRTSPWWPMCPPRSSPRSRPTSGLPRWPPPRATPVPPSRPTPRTTSSPSR